MEGEVLCDGVEFGLEGRGDGGEGRLLRLEAFTELEAGLAWCKGRRRA